MLIHSLLPAFALYFVNGGCNDMCKVSLHGLRDEENGTVLFMIVSRFEVLKNTLEDENKNINNCRY